MKTTDAVLKLCPFRHAPCIASGCMAWEFDPRQQVLPRPLDEKGRTQHDQDPDIPPGFRKLRDVGSRSILVVEEHPTEGDCRLCLQAYVEVST